MCEITEVTKYFDNHCVAIIHWMREEGKRSYLKGEQRETEKDKQQKEKASNRRDAKVTSGEKNIDQKKKRGKIPWPPHP